MAKRGKKQKQQLQASDEKLTLMQHVDELKSRLFWVAVIFIIASACVYPFFHQIIAVITEPIGDHKLYYFTVTGGLSFIIKVCMYVGIVAAIPALVYHLYKFIAPAIGNQRSKNVAIYTISSAVLGLVGIVFSYYVILPAALQFLTDFSLGQIDNLLSIDSYVSFVIAYLIAGALLFQLPVILLAINTVHRLKPKKLLSYERFVIIGAFIFAALISPTPDAINQTLLALPIVAMYQVGVFLVWWSQRREAKKLAKLAKKQHQQPSEPIATSGYAGTPVAPVMPASSLASTPVSFAAADIKQLRPTLQANRQLVQHQGQTMKRSQKMRPLGASISPLKPQIATAKPPLQQPVSPRPVVATIKTPVAPTLSPRLSRPMTASAMSRPAIQRTATPPQRTQISRHIVLSPSPRSSQPRRPIDGFGVYASTS